MATIVTRAGKGSALTHAEVDANFNNLNTAKAERSAANTFSATNTFSGNISSSGTNTFSGGNTFSSSVTLSGTCSFTGANTFTNVTGQTFRRAAGQDGVLIRGRAGGASSYTAELAPATLTANRVITLPDSSGTVITTATGTIDNSNISATAEIAVSKLADGTPRQLLQTDAAGTGVEWTDNVSIPGTLDVIGTATFGVDGVTNGYLNVVGIANEGLVISPYGTGVQIYLQGTSQELSISANSYWFTATGGFNAFQIYHSFITRTQSAPNPKNTTTTLAASELTSGLITSTTAAAVSLTLPTATTMSTYLNSLQSGQFSDGQAFDWSIINTGATNSVTVIANTGHTYVGRTTVAANTSGRFTTKRLTNTSYETYRIA